LIGRLRASRTERVVAIFAGPGFGKTTLLTQWADADERPFAWVSLDDRDNDPTVFLAGLAQALHRIGAATSPLFDALATPGGARETTLIARLGTAVLRMAPSVLVLDDVHSLRNQACIDAIATLIVHAPESFQVVVAGRTEPALPLPRLRVQGQVLDVRAADLALDAREADTLLRAAGIALSEEGVADLVASTEGWAVGLCLAAMSIEASNDSSAAAGIAGDDRLVGEYLRSELLSHLSRKTTSFLIRTAVLDRMCGSLCDAVLEETGSAGALESIMQRNLLVAREDRRREWYRYHSLFRELLLAELHRREPHMVPELRRRAAQWCEDNGYPDAAIEYAQAADDADRAARLFLSSARSAYGSGRFATVQRWMGWFKDADLARYPVVALAGAWLLVLVGDLEGALGLVETAENHLGTELLDDGVTPAVAGVALFHAVTCGEGVERMADDVQVALDLTPADSPNRAMALQLSGVASLLASDIESADAAFADAAEAGKRFGAAESVVVALAERSVLAMQRGDWDAAESLALEGRSFVEMNRLHDYPTSAMAFVASARVSLHRGRSSAAREDLVRAQRLRPQLMYSMPWLAVQVRLELARAYLALADPAGARTMLRETEAVFRRSPDLGALEGFVSELMSKVENAPATAPGMSTLTAAELRLLPYLPTYLSFREIGERLSVSPHTVKSQAISIYRKLDVTSRSDAIEHAQQLGLLDP
jgi:LuxR family maltose regulon positive regulatory protein